MDAIKFLKTAKRRYISNPDEHFSAIYFDFPDFEVYVKDVEEWAKEHPAKTRQSVFLEQYPEASLTEDGILSLCPIAVSSEYRDENGNCVSCIRKCGDCRREFWTQEVE